MQLRICRLLKPHGLKGAFKLELYTDEPERRLQPGAIFDLQVPESSPWHGKSLTLKELRWYNGNPVAFFDGVVDRNASESLTKAILVIEQSEAELPAENDAWYDHQLAGMTVVRDGKEIGTVTRVDHFPAQDILVISRGGADGSEASEVLLPLINDFVPEIDLAAKRVVITPPGGLFEDVAGTAEDTDSLAENSDSVNELVRKIVAVEHISTDESEKPVNRRKKPDAGAKVKPEQQHPAK